MARKSTGAVIETDLADGSRSFAIRFRIDGERRYRTLGYSFEGWTRKRAEEELANVMADVRRGLWREPEPQPQPAPRFHSFAERWFEQQRLEGGAKGRGLTPAGEADLRWRLEKHLLPYFAVTLKDPRLDEITVAMVDGFRQHKVREGRIGPTSINKCLGTVAAILELAAEYDHISKNPARGKRRRLRQARPPRTYLDRADHIAALLDGAGDLDRAARQHRGMRRALVALLLFGGPRISEALALRWRDLDFARAIIHVRGTKTDAARRDVTMLAVLRDELLAWKMTCPDSAPASLVFATTTGRALGATNVRRRVLAAAVERANVRLERDGLEPITVRLTPDSLRRTFATLLVAAGEDPAWVMREIGHRSSALTMEVYTHARHRRDGEGERLAALVRGEDWAAIGQSPVPSTPATSGAAAA